MVAFHFYRCPLFLVHVCARVSGLKKLTTVRKIKGNSQNIIFRIFQVYKYDVLCEILMSKQPKQPITHTQPILRTAKNYREKATTAPLFHDRPYDHLTIATLTPRLLRVLRFSTFFTEYLQIFIFKLQYCRLIRFINVKAQKRRNQTFKKTPQKSPDNAKGL